MTDTPSRQVLDTVLGRSVTFLSAAATHRGIAAILSTRGYDAAAHQEGWDLVHAITGYNPNQGGAPPLILLDPAVVAARKEIDEWDEPNFLVARAALERSHPDQLAYVFADGLAAATGADSQVTVDIFLRRLDALEHGDDRKSTRKADRAALDKLATRSIDAAERKRMRALLGVAEGKPTPADAPPQPLDETARLEKLIALYGWYKEWSNTARAIIKRRDYLIRLGLARRKVTKAEAPK